MHKPKTDIFCGLQWKKESYVLLCPGGINPVVKGSPHDLHHSQRASAHNSNCWCFHWSMEWHIHSSCCKSHKSILLGGVWGAVWLYTFLHKRSSSVWCWALPSNRWRYFLDANVLSVRDARPASEWFHAVSFSNPKKTALGFQKAAYNLSASTFRWVISMA